MKFKTENALSNYLKERVNPEKSIYYGKSLNQANTMAQYPELNQIEKDKEELEASIETIPAHLRGNINEKLESLQNEYNQLIGKVNNDLTEQDDYDLVSLDLNETWEIEEENE